MATHPLAEAWDAYAHTVADTSTYASSYVHLARVATCEEWGSLWHHVPAPRVFAQADRCLVIQGKRVTALSFFRHYVKPEWEDPHNQGGITVTARAILDPETAHDAWHTLCADCAGCDTDLLGVQVLQKWTRQKRSYVPQVRFDAWMRAGSDAARMATHLSQLVSLPFDVLARETTSRTSHRRSA